MKTKRTFERLKATDEESLSTAIALYLDAFQNEAVLNFAYKLSDPKGKQRMYQFTKSYLQLAIRNGDQVLVAKEDDAILAIAIMDLPCQHQNNCQFKDYIKLWKDALPLLGYLKYPHLIRLLRGMNEPKDLPKKANTLQIFAVSPKVQGIGKQFLAELIDQFTTPNGLYLTTGIQRSADYYQDAGFKLIETRQFKGLSVFHLYHDQFDL